MDIAITGANSSVGNILLRHLAERGDIQVVACVRSARAIANLPASTSISARAIDVAAAGSQGPDRNGRSVGT